MTLLYHCYERHDDGLCCPLTRQRLLPVRVADDHCLFEYSDGEISIVISVRFATTPAYSDSRHALIDWNIAEHRGVRADYGLWRRLTWFLLDALLSWSADRERNATNVRTVGA